jgi:AMP phosphorylase
VNSLFGFPNHLYTRSAEEYNLGLKLRAKPFELEAGGKPIVVLNEEDVEDLGVRSLGRVVVQYGGREITAIVNTTRKFLKRGEVGLYQEVWKFLEVSEDVEVDVESSGFPKSTAYIRSRLNGRRLNYDEMRAIVTDMVKGNLSEVEITSFVIALENHAIDMDESFSLSYAMFDTGKRLELNRDIIVDKHSIGGVPGDKTTLLVVPIIAACGLTIPKSSSRAITSAAGTADRAEILMDVSLGIAEMKSVVEKTNGCIVWGGSLNLAPADDMFIKVEYPLAIDPLLLPSIMSKKKAVGANHLVIDIPTGRGTKIKTLEDANLLANDFIDLGRQLGMKTQCALTYGEQPLGYTIGSALEAREALEVIMGKKMINDVVDKAIDIAGILLGMSGIANGRQVALNALKSGRAEKKLREIIAAQGGNPNITPSDIPVGEYSFDVTSSQHGFVLWIDNMQLVNIARTAGSPKDIGAGVILHKKLGDKVEQNEKLFTIYSRHATKLQRVETVLKEATAFAVGEKMEMLLGQVIEAPIHEKAFILER